MPDCGRWKEGPKWPQVPPCPSWTYSHAGSLCAAVCFPSWMCALLLPLPPSLFMESFYTQPPLLLVDSLHLPMTTYVHSEIARVLGGVVYSIKSS